MNYNVHMTHNEKHTSLEKRMAACPIHNWANVADYLKRAQVPNYLWEPFYELVVARGE